MTKGEFLSMFKACEDDTLTLCGDEALAAVQQDGYALQYVREQTPEICMAAVQQNGYALQYVNLGVFE